MSEPRLSETMRERIARHAAMPDPEAVRPLSAEELANARAKPKIATYRNSVWLATLDAVRTPDPDALRAAAQAVVAQAEPDEGFEGEYAEYLVPVPALDALRAALAEQPTGEPDAR